MGWFFLFLINIQTLIIAPTITATRPRLDVTRNIFRMRRFSVAFKLKIPLQFYPTQRLVFNAIFRKTRVNVIFIRRLVGRRKNKYLIEYFCRCFCPCRWENLITFWTNKQGTGFLRRIVGLKATPFFSPILLNLPFSYYLIKDSGKWNFPESKW